MHLICPPKILHNLCFSFLLGIAAVLTEIETMLMQNEQLCYKTKGLFI